MKYNVIILVLALSFSTPSFAQEESPKLLKVQTMKNPGNAFALSFVLPGAGQMSNGQTYLGIGTFVGCLALAGTGYAFYDRGYGGTKANQKKYGHYKDIGIGLLATAGVVYAAQLFYAPVYAYRWNKKNGFDTSAMVGLTENGLALQLKF